MIDGKMIEDTIRRVNGTREGAKRFRRGREGRMMSGEKTSESGMILSTEFDLEGSPSLKTAITEVPKLV
jgi:hypothetical protein